MWKQKLKMLSTEKHMSFALEVFFKEANEKLKTRLLKKMKARDNRLVV